MSRRWIILLFCLTVPLFVLPHSAASGGLRVDEATTRILLREGQVELAVENSAGREVAAHVRLELLDPGNEVRAQAERDETLSAGASSVRLPLILPTNALTEPGQILWYRLRYRLSPTAPADGAINSIESIISLSEITPDIFELQVAAPQYAREGTRCRLHVRAAHPITTRPVKDVSVAAEIDFADGRKAIPLKATGLTDAEGYTTLDFNLPRNIREDQGEIKVVASLGGLAQEASEDIRIDRSARTLLNTDKPLYQPGQVVHMRALILDPTRHAMPGADGTLEISDEEDTTVFRAALKTSRFGIASADWPIPEGTRLGDYNIKVELNGGEPNDATSQGIKISRYDLPNFVVNVQPDREYYLPGQMAEVEVRGEYLFGEPVRRGHVRVVRERERTWNYSEQRWETEEDETSEGDIDQDGRFVAHINLEKEQAELADSGDGRYRDLNYAAYLTDPTTTRTEQRRFDLRITKEAIHIYATEADYGQAEGLPLEFYLSTFYADGTPAQCEVAISEKASSASHHGRAARELKSEGQSLQRVRTNRFGIAKVKGPVIAEQEEDGREMTLTFAARDRRGKVGYYDQEFRVSRETAIRVETDKTLYRAGDPIKVWITANKPELTIILDVARDLQAVHSELVHLHNGQAFLTLPYSADFKDRLTIAASAAETPQSYYYRNEVGRRTVLFPRDRELKLDVQLERDTYRPGEDATADLQVRTPDGRSCESALGVVVLDKAVEERARTNQEFGSYGFYNNFHSFLYGDDNLSGITHRELERLDLHHGVPEGVELAAELLLQRAGFNYELRLSGRRDYTSYEREVFFPLTSTQLLPVNAALYAHYLNKGEHPIDEQALRRVLAAQGINFDAMRDPWGMPYRAEFSVEKGDDVLEIVSAGPDKRLGTKDDFQTSRMAWPYFLKEGEKISRAVAQYHARTGGFIRDAETLKSELLREGVDFDSWRDRWGRPYGLSFGIRGTFYSFEVRSGGPDRRLATSASYSSDDFTIWKTWDNYFAETLARIDAALAAYFRATAGRFPTQEAELREALHRSGMELDDLRDIWGRRFYVDYRTEVQFYRSSGNRLTQDEDQDRPSTRIIPNTRQVSTVRLFSPGPDGLSGTSDDFNVGNFWSTNYEPDARHHRQRLEPAPVPLAAGSGMIQGMVLDPQGAAVAGAKVTITGAGGASRETITDGNGFFVMTNLASGFYKVMVEMAGFKSAAIENVEVIAGTTNTITVNLEVGEASATVNVTDVAQIDQTSTAVGANLNDQLYQNVPVKRNVSSLYHLAPGLQAVTKSGDGEENSLEPRSQISTPRLREYFPETLIWQPALETDTDGRAQLHFKLADNITTWKMSVIGSTVDGEVGTAETEFRAFQPFFVEHDPPRVLTEGDEIDLPVVLRNYTDKAQAVNLEIKPESWFALLGPPQKQAEIPAGDAARETFRFRAIAMTDEGKQRITATGSEEASDAVEKPVSVHPDGQEMAVTDSRVFADAGVLEANIPEAAINGATRAGLKIYPNTMAHVVEGIEGILQRPHGCGEQTISSTYPSVLVLRAYKRQGGAPPSIAQRYARAGYERLLNYRTESGGFTYWGHGEPDLALTAYALRFLNDAREVLAVDEDVIDEAREWLVKEQNADGSWSGGDLHGATDGANVALNTSFVARVLALSGTGGATTQTGATTGSTAGSDPLTRALSYLSRRVDEMNEPYLIASYALAAQSAGRKADAARAIKRLRALAQNRGETSYWTSDTSTPFYGWGLAGQIETTALAVQALARSSSSGSDVTSDDSLASRGVLFLLRNKDRYGVWLSTQATINVLDALIKMTATASDKSNGTVEVVVNGRPATSIQMPQDDKLNNPIFVDLSKFISNGNNRVEIRRPAGSVQATAQLVATYWMPWATSGGDSNLGHGATRALHLTVAFDKNEAKVGDEITCRVNAVRTGSYGYGMLLAEIGLPPGADVDRASLERAVKESDWSLSRYDILPDRLVVYLWPPTGGTRFEFKFRPRYGLAAQTAPSVLYDYYNPDAKTIIAPTKFTVR
jgi:hypothetical protein